MKKKITVNKTITVSTTDIPSFFWDFTDIGSLSKKLEDYCDFMIVSYISSNWVGISASYENVKMKLDFGYDEYDYDIINGLCFSFDIIRDETDDEYDKRLKKEESIRKRKHTLYMKLKEEFDVQSNTY